MILLKKSGGGHDHHNVHDSTPVDYLIPFLKVEFHVLMNDGGDDGDGLVFDEEIHVSACASVLLSCSFEFELQSLV